MEDNSKYEDIAYLLTDLCGICSNAELAILTKLAVRMQQDNEFRKNYLKQLKLKYIRAIPQIQKGTYQKVSFSVLHKTILSTIEKSANVQRNSFLNTNGY